MKLNDVFKVQVMHWISGDDEPVSVITKTFFTETSALSYYHETIEMLKAQQRLFDIRVVKSTFLAYQSKLS